MFLMGIVERPIGAVLVKENRELVNLGGKTFVRLRAGNAIDCEKLKEIGISEENIKDFIDSVIEKNPDHVRLTQNFDAGGDIKWAYLYRVLEVEKATDLIIGREVVYYSGVPVFAQGILLFPIDE